MNNSKILLAHGSGGKLTHELIKNIIVPKVRNPFLDKLGDSAVFDVKQKELAFSTDSFVVNPLFFPGGDIGKLAVYGTVNDLVVSGALPLYLSLALIVEEGVEYVLLEKIVYSISNAVKRCGVKIITGDFKVVEKGACDKLFINTAGIGSMVSKLDIRNIKTGDKVIITGRVAEHGLSVLGQRKGIDFGFNIKSDCINLDSLLIPLLKKYKGIKFMRDPTRGGIATTLNEISQSAKLGILIEESRIPISSRVRGASELLGMDPLYIANEGKAILIVDSNSAAGVLRMLKKHPQGKYAEVIGEVIRRSKGVMLKTIVGTTRILEMMASDPLPRIC